MRILMYLLLILCATINLAWFIHGIILIVKENGSFLNCWVTALNFVAGLSCLVSAFNLMNLEAAD